MRAADAHAGEGDDRLRVVLTLVLVALALVPSGANAATSLSLAAPGEGAWTVNQMWHGGALGGGIVPAGTSIDLAPAAGSPLDVYAVAAGRIVQTCVSPTQTTVFIDSPNLGVVGYSHLATGSVLSSGTVATGQRIGRLATVYEKSACATSWTGPHLHLSLPARVDALRIAGQLVAKNAVLQLGRRAPKTFGAHPRVDLALTRSTASAVVCADGLAGNVVHVRLTRVAARAHPAWTWTATKRATSRCVRFANLDGTGTVVAGVNHALRAAVNQLPSPTWTIPGCYRNTNGQGLCDRARRRE